MALTCRKSLFQTIIPLMETKRFRGKINVQKPKPPHFEKAKYIELTKPYFISPYKGKTVQELCKKSEEKLKKEPEENPFQNILAKELRDRFISSRLVAFYHMNPITARQQFKAYAMFLKENMFLKNYGKRTLEIALKETPYEPILDYYISRNIMLLSPEPKLKELLRITKRFPQLVLLYAVYEGRLISKDEILHYSQIPNLQAAQAGLAQTLDSIGSQIVSQLNCHQTTLVSHLQERVKQLEENK